MNSDLFSKKEKCSINDANKLNLEFPETQHQKISSEDIRSAVTDPIPLQSLPHIDPYHSTNITALAGTNTKLNCRVYR